MDSVLLSRWWQFESHLFVFLKSLFSILFLVSYLLHQFLYLETVFVFSVKLTWPQKMAETCCENPQT